MFFILNNNNNNNNIMNMTLDDEWSQFLSNQCQNTSISLRTKTSTSEITCNKPCLKEKLSSVNVEQKWISSKLEPKYRVDCSLKDGTCGDSHNIRALLEESPEDVIFEEPIMKRSAKTYDAFIPNEITPQCEELYISTKTKVLFLNQEIDIHRIFWNIPILEYWKPQTGVIKKQMKIVSKTPEEYEETREKMVREYCYNEHVIKQINNPTARRIKYKDERKITIGISKKDIINTRIKQKNAFYNCFAIIIRINYEGIFKEIHVKIFNTGKMEIPGVLNIKILETIQPMILSLIQPFLDTPLEYVENKGNENVLINSNFNCGYFINRERLHAILKSGKYGIEAAFDPCSYPGVKCKFYFNNDIGFVEDGSQNGMILSQDRGMKMSELIENKKYTEVSFMIFRTGSCLIVGNCSERILVFIYQFIRRIFEEEYSNIAIMNEDPVIKNKQLKLKKRIISVSI